MQIEICLNPNWMSIVDVNDDDDGGGDHDRGGGVHTWTESCCAILVAQRQAALSSVSFGSLPQGQADTAADTRKGEQSRFHSKTEVNPTTSALTLPILLHVFHLCKQ